MAPLCATLKSTLNFHLVLSAPTNVCGRALIFQLWRHQRNAATTLRAGARTHLFFLNQGCTPWFRGSTRIPEKVVIRWVVSPIVVDDVFSKVVWKSCRMIRVEVFVVELRRRCVVVLASGARRVVRSDVSSLENIKNGFSYYLVKPFLSS